MTEDSLVVKFSDPAHGITDKSELLAVAGVSSEIAMSVMSRFKEISEDGLRKEILSILADN